MVKTISIGGKEVTFRASAAIPRMYRMRFRRDIMKDMAEIDKAIKGGDQIPIKMLEVFEDVAYLMAKHADPKAVPDSVEDWLDQFETFSIYEVFPEIADLWDLNIETLEKPKKK